VQSLRSLDMHAAFLIIGFNLILTTVVTSQLLCHGVCSKRAEPGGWLLVGRMCRGGQDPGRGGGRGAVPRVPQDCRVSETHGFRCKEIGHPNVSASRAFIG
jgi:hypothetical protein